MRPQFTPAENRILHRCRSRSRSRHDVWGWLLIFAPFAAFAVYGLVHRDAIAVFIAWGGSFGWMLWWLVASARSGATLLGILDKYEQALADTDATIADGQQSAY